MSELDIGQSVENGISELFEALPQAIGIVALVIVGYFVAKILQRLTRKMLAKLRFDNMVNNSPAGGIVGRLIDRPSRFVSKVAFWVVWVAFLSFAVSALNVPAITQFVAGVYSYIPNVIGAVVIFLVASSISAGSNKFIRRVLGNTPTSNILRTVAPAVVMSIATFMILNELEIAKDIVNITYIAIMGSLSLGLALSFGLGGRDLASRILEDAYDSSKEKLSANEVKYGANRAKSEAKKVARKL
jgi:hypothetical protein